MSMLPIVTTKAELRSAIANWRAKGERVGLVPTMGALHAGHLSLIDVARRRVQRTVATIFVNPKQFGANEDFGAYPRDEASDAEKLAGAGCDLLYAPSVGEIYPEGFATNVHVSGVTEGLCGATRSGHFDGVATVVTKLLLQARPDVAVFSEKDYQQLLTIKRLVGDLDIDVEIVDAPIVREADGLAMSSRNRYLSAEERQVAAALPRTLRHIAESLAKSGDNISKPLQDGRETLRAAGFTRIDYIEVRDADTLAPLNRVRGNARIFAAAIIGRTRLIDNMPIPCGDLR